MSYNSEALKRHYQKRYNSGDKRFAVWIPAELLPKLTDYAIKHGLTFNKAVARVFADFFAEPKK